VIRQGNQTALPANLFKTENDCLYEVNEFLYVITRAGTCYDHYFTEPGIYFNYDEDITGLIIFDYADDTGGVELSMVDPTASAIIKNDGTVPAGVVFELTATISSKNPRIYNLSTGEFIGLEMELQAGDRVLINTTTGSKSAVHIRDGVRSNCINTVMVGSSWLQMAIGSNECSYTLDEGECTLGIYHTNMYIGV
jgi:hypothetical protein